MTIATSLVLSRYLQTDAIAIDLEKNGTRRTWSARIDRRASALPLLTSLSHASDRSDISAPILLVEGAVVPEAETADLVISQSEDMATIHFDTGVVCEAGVRRMIGHLESILDSLTREPEASPHEREMLTRAELAQFEVWNDTTTDYDLETSFLERLERQIRKSPDAPAAEDERRTISYAELGRDSDLVAVALRDRGVGPGSVVALMVTRGVEALVAVIGTMKASAAYLPIDNSNPLRRVALTLTQGAPDLCLAHRALVPTLTEAMSASDASCEIMALEDALLERPTIGHLPPAGHPDDLAYVLPTSGSTGVPKATMIEHRGMLNHSLGMIDILDLQPLDVVAQNAPLTFDISVWQMVTPLMVGAKVAFIPDDALGAPDRVIDWIHRTNVSILQLVPSLMAAVLQMTEYDTSVVLPRSLRWVIPTGEALPVGTARRWLERFPAPPLLNAYGPAECSDDVTVQAITEPPAADLASLPIGTPLPNVSVYVLDHHGQRAPIGVVGEICVGGTGVGRGYRNDPARTAAVFTTNPFPPYGRLYHTGDLGRFLEDGSLQFVGRADDQIKIGGIRIEPGEVEAALTEHPDVRESVVTARGKQLVAYLTAGPGFSVTRAELRKFLSQRLPGYMIPRAFIHLSRLPLNPSGKVARERLPVPDPTDFGVEDRSPESASDCERRLQSIWADLLDRPVGLDDDFFGLGGTSLLAAIMLWRVRRELGPDLPVSTPAAAPTIRLLARAIAEESEQRTNLVPLRTGGERTPLFLAPGQGGSTLGFVHLARHLDPGRPVWGLDLQRRRDEPADPQTFETLVDVYLKAMRSVQPTGPYIVGGWCLGGEVAFEIARRLQREGDEAALVVLLQTDSRSYPRYRPGVGKIRRAWYAVLDRVQYEHEAITGLGGRASLRHVLDHIVMKSLIRFRVWVESGIAFVMKGLGRSYKGSDEYHHRRWHRADGAAYVGHAFAPYSGNVFQIRARHQPRGIIPDPTLGWTDLVRGRLETAEVSGHHWNFLREPNVREVAEHLSRRLDEMDERMAQQCPSPTDGPVGELG